MRNAMEKKGRRVLLAATGINLVSGMLYTWGIISRTLMEELGWTSRQASLPYTLATVFFVVAMVAFGTVQDQRGPRFTATIGVLLMGTGMILSGLRTEPLPVAAAFGILTGSGIGILNVSTLPPAVKWFPKELKGLVSGVVVGGVSLSSLLYSPLGNWLIEDYGVSTVFLVIGVFSLLTGVFLARILANPPRQSRQPGLDRVGSSQDRSWREMVRTREFWLVWLMMALASSSGLMVIGHVVTIARVQAGWSGGFLLVMLLALFNTLGRFTGGGLSDRMGRINLIRLIFILQLVNMLALGAMRTVPVLALGVAVAGMCYGAIFSVFPATISDLYGLRHFGINFALMFTGWGVGGIIGPMTAAWIFDLTGGYAMAYLVSAGLIGIALALSYLYEVIRKAEEPLEVT